MTKRIALVLFLALAVCGAAFAGDDAAAAQKTLSVKTYQFKHKDASKAADVLKTLVSAEGSISIQPSANSIVITDRPENMKAITAALEKYDTAPQAFKLSVRLVSASRGEARRPDELKDIAPSLSMLPYNAFEALGSANVDGREGEPGVVDLASGYRADFKFGDYDPSSDSVKISDLKIAKFQGDQLTQILKATTMNLKLGQTVILGAGKPQGQKALILVISARR
ncbi:MAG TPA: secretin N-terminal domain-containing protein [Thermoanaerobaculia bacterium]|nr:secretin N-terminal domain-containing protein [Thermoanaerobaculia bacterium]